MDASTLRNQTQSPLLRLPAELRNRIYEYVFRMDCIDYHGNQYRWSYHRNHNPVRKTSTTSLSLSSLLASLPVCRQYYAETKLLIFELNSFRARPRNLIEAVRKMPNDVRNAISVVRIYENRNWTSRGVWQESLLFPNRLSNLRKIQVHSWAPRVSGDVHLFAHEWNRLHVPEEDEVLRLRVEKWFRDLHSKETEDALMNVRQWVRSCVREGVQVTSIDVDSAVPSYKQNTENRWEVM